MTKLISTKDALSEYMRTDPDHVGDFAWLQSALDAGVDVFDRQTTPGHVTVGVILYRRDIDAVLHIHHKALDKWLLPGGHVEARDDTLESAAIRELWEETGIQLGTPLPALILIEINKHEIPANPIKHEPLHDHYDFRYFVQITTQEQVILQEEEVLAYCWISLAQMQLELANRIRARL
jgi:8-oxo-dGTP pyrophosphatase MutT (NUDIX family)